MSSVRTENVLVEAVNAKSKFPKFNDGAILAGGNWINVKKGMGLSKFTKGETVAVMIETNDKGYETIIGLPPTANAVSNGAEKVKDAPAKKDYQAADAAKSERILVQGLIQAVSQSPALSTLPYTDAKSFAKLVLEVTDLLIAGVKERS